MPSKNRRKFKFKSKLLLITLPLILIPILLIFIVRIGLFNHIKNQKIEFNNSMLYQLSLTLEEKLKNPDFEISQIELINEFKQSDFFVNGLLYIFDNNNNKIFSNTSQRILVNDHEINESDLLNNNKVNSIMLNNFKEKKDVKVAPNKCVSFNCKVSNIDFYSFFLNTGNFGYMHSNIKLLYFYPKFYIIYPITSIVFWLIFMSAIIFISLMFVVAKMGDSLVFPLNELDYLTKKVGQGHLNFDVVTYSKDEVGNLFNNSKDLINNYQKTLISILNSSNNLTGYNNTLEKSIEDFNNSLNSQVDSTSGNSEVFNKFSDLTTKILNSIKEAQGLIDQAQIQSDNSANIINQMIAEITDIADTTQQISSIVELINGISEKTRLLSVNSAIEASRAGDAGKGFGVVASEIRKLALQAKGAANQIGELIKINDKKIVSGVSKTYEAIDVLRNIDSSIKLINDKVGQINASAQEEKNINKDIININNHFTIAVNGNINSISSISKLKSLFSLEVEKIKDEIGKFVFDVYKKEVIRDYKLSSPEEKKRIRDKKALEKLNTVQDRAQIEYKDKMKKLKEKRSNKLDTVKALTLYKPKRRLFGLLKK